jgi:hypothetical protein
LNTVTLAFEKQTATSVVTSLNRFSPSPTGSNGAALW